MVSLTEKIEEIEKKEILDALGKTGWNKSRAARLLGITERMIGYRIKKLGLKREVIGREAAVEVEGGEMQINLQ